MTKLLPQFLVVIILLCAQCLAHDLPPFLAKKVDAAMNAQASPNNALHDSLETSHLIKAQLQARNHKFFNRDQFKYDATLVISRDDLRVDMVGESTHYTYHNGRLLVNDRCRHGDTFLPPVVKLRHLVEKLVDLKGHLPTNGSNSLATLDSSLNTVCAGMDTYGIMYAQEHFVLCADQNELKHIVGRNVWVDILEWSVDQNIIQDALQSMIDPEKESILKTCPLPTGLTLAPNAFKSFKSSEAWFKSSLICSLPFLRDSTMCQDTEDPVKPTRDCVFLHGVGEVVTPETGKLTDTFHDYWGYIEDYTPQCKTRTFIHQETKQRGWDNKTLQTQFCDAALVGNAPNNRTIHDKTLFVHSMGNMVLADALKNGICQIDSKTTTWYNAMGPMDGSRAADMLLRICDPKNIRDKLYRMVAIEGGYCIPDSDQPYPSYKTLSPEYVKDKELKKIAKQYTTGNMCGDSPMGLLTRYSVLEILSFVVQYDFPNDGMVPIPSCSFKDDGYTSHAQSDWYRADVNHADGTCRSGDSWIWSTKQPCSFYTAKV